MTHPTPWLDQPASLMAPDVRFLLLQAALARHFVVENIESGAVPVALTGGGRWRDVRPMTDPREHSGEVLDINVQTLYYAEEAGIMERHPEHPHMVRIVETAEHHHPPKWPV